IVKIPELKSAKDFASLINQEISTSAININYDTKSVILDAVGNDIKQLENFLVFINTYNTVLKDIYPEITVELIDSFFNANVRVDIFNLVEEIANRNKQKSLDLFSKSIKSKSVEMIPLLSILVTRFMQIALLKDESYAKKLGVMPAMSPWQLKKIQANLRYWKQEELGDIITNLIIIHSQLLGINQPLNIELQFVKFLNSI
ncbi:MAG: hypothetical protein LBN03_02515, partial [Bifidobacteriaceae bacterium]|nr:hypothetical protein [Bifidobacteriaceae bacterium]